MKLIKLFYNGLDALSLGIWGLTIFDLMFLNIDFLSDVDGIAKTSMAVLGALYFGLSIPHKLKMQKLDRNFKEEELEKLRLENDKKISK